MSRKSTPPQNPGRRRFLKLALTMLLLVLIARFAASYWLQYQRQTIETAISRATGLQTTIQGPISLNLITNSGIHLRQIEMKYNGSLMLSANSVNIGFEILPLFNHELIVHTVGADGLAIHLLTDINGKPLVPPLISAPDKARHVQLNIPNLIELNDIYLDVRTPKGQLLYEVQGLNVTLLPYVLKTSSIQNGAVQVGFNANIDFKRGHFKKIETGAVELSIHYRHQRITADISEAKVWDGTLKGTVSLDTITSEPKLGLNFDFNDFSADKTAILIQRDPVIQGKLNLNGDLLSQGKNLQTLLKNLRGTVTLKGSDLQLMAIDIDSLITQVIKTQEYNLTDAAAYFFIGPLGLSVTKGYNLSKVTRDLKSTTSNKIVRILTRWSIDQGIASADDVAMETKRHWLAVKGRVNLYKASFEKFRIAVVDKRGCAVIVQNLDGPIASPEVSKLNFLLNPTKPIFKIIEKSTNYVLSGSACVPFYSGQLLPTVEIKNTTNQNNDDSQD